MTVLLADGAAASPSRRNERQAVVRPPAPARDSRARPSRRRPATRACAVWPGVDSSRAEHLARRAASRRDPTRRTRRGRVRRARAPAIVPNASAIPAPGCVGSREIGEQRARNSVARKRLLELGRVPPAIVVVERDGRDRQPVARRAVAATPVAATRVVSSKTVHDRTSSQSWSSASIQKTATRRHAVIARHLFGELERRERLEQREAADRRRGPPAGRSATGHGPWRPRDGSPPLARPGRARPRRRCCSPMARANC